MKKINTSFVTDPSIQQPFTVESLDFLHSGNKQMIEALCIHLIENKGYAYSTSVPYKLVTQGGVYSYIFFNGELYYFDEAILISALVAVLDTAADVTADPLQFSDGINRNVHDNRILKRSTNALGTGVFDLNTIVDLSNPLVESGIAPTLLNSWSAVTTPKYFRYFKDASSGSFVSLQGSVNKTGSNTGVIFVLPIGFRPPSDTVVLAVMTIGGVDTAHFLFINASTGEITVQNTSANTTTIYFDGIIFNL
jgi:hypothetical protein